MLKDRWIIEHLAEILFRRGIKNLVVSPGSRNAPILEAFCKRRSFRCIPVVDERSAAFFALGMAQQLQQPVALACTSGSAPLNYAPAIAEAYYQRIPLLVITADRPLEYIDQGDGQTIRQQNMFANIIKKSFQLPQSLKSSDDLWYAGRQISEALNALSYPVAGPVHINIPFTEPLYGAEFEGWPEPKDFFLTPTQTTIRAETLHLLAEEWAMHKKKLVIAGQMSPDCSLQAHLNELALDPSVVVLTETISNLHGPDLVAWIDRCLAAMPKGDPEYVPDLLITIGGPVVSKVIKSWLRNSPVKSHWHIDPEDLAMDTYQHLTRVFAMEPCSFLQQFKTRIQQGTFTYGERFRMLSLKARERHQAFLKDCPYSDLKIFEAIVAGIPADYQVQLANSTAVRYAQLFDYTHELRFDSNRGVSGIDGCTSTAAGAAFASGKNTLLITGDLAFFYDSNGLWIKNLPKNLKIILIHNGGGGIFRFLNGPESTGLLEEYFEARHQTSAQHLCKAFGVDYHFASDPESLKAGLENIFSPCNAPTVLEVQSPAEPSAATLRNYFKFLAT